jgi:UDP-N-acetylglucosamine 2-epimerase (non-hydrolysing)
MEEASVMMVCMNTERILQGITQLELQQIDQDRNFRRVQDYSMPNVSDKVVRVILSYTDYVNRVVWGK